MDMAVRAAHDADYRMSEEFGEWLADDAHRRLFEDVMDAREAMLGSDPQLQPDTEEALRRVMARDNHGNRLSTWHRNRMVWSLVGMAATVAIIICVWLGWQQAAPLFSDASQKKPATIDNIAEERAVFVLHADSEPQLVQISLGEGRRVTITPENKRLLVSQGIKVSDNGIAYHTSRTMHDSIATHSLTTPRGQTIKLELEDGTTVWLNSESRLTYPNSFKGSERRVRLEGEAYFKVAHNDRQPFLVDAGNVETRVLGTEFNIRAYDGKDCNVTLVKGSVRVKNLSNGHEHTLEPGQSTAVSHDGKGMVTTDVDVMETTAWKDHYFCFRNEELTDIMTGLSHWYNVEVVFTKEKSMHYHFNFWADKDAPLESTIHLLNEVGKVKVRMQGKRVVVN